MTSFGELSWSPSNSVATSVTTPFTVRVTRRVPCSHASKLPSSSSASPFELPEGARKLVMSPFAASRQISFNLLHKDCGSRLRQQYFCAKEDVPVARDQMVKGYEFAKDQYVMFSPEELKARSQLAGAVHLRVKDVSAATLKERLARVAGAARADVLAERDGTVELRVYPDGASARGRLTRDVAELAAQEQWPVAEIHTEEGRLDEVFRSITLPDTVRAAA